jgi:hypothetical protein
VKWFAYQGERILPPIEDVKVPRGIQIGDEDEKTMGSGVGRCDSINDANAGPD